MDFVIDLAIIIGAMYVPIALFYGIASIISSR